jgi:hypothetical protein
MFDALKKLLELIPIVNDGPPWVRIVFVLWVINTALLGVGIVVSALLKPASADDFAITYPTQNLYVEERRIAVTGAGLPKDAEPVLELYRHAAGERTLVPQVGRPLRRGRGDWRYEWITFDTPGTYELLARVSRSGKIISYVDPIRFVVAQWLTAPVPPTSTSSTPERPTPATHEQPFGDVDLSRFVTIHDQGPEGTAPAFAAITAMEVSLARANASVVLSARYVYEKARIHAYGPNAEDRRIQGMYMTTIEYVLEHYGAPPETAWPYIPDQYALPPGTSWDQLDSIASERRAKFYRLSGLNDVVPQLRAGRPVIIALRLTNKIMSDPSGVIDTASADEQLVGIHPVTIVGYDSQSDTYKFANSWGTGWGTNGFGKLSRAAAMVIAQPENFWAVEASRSQ